MTFRSVSGKAVLILLSLALLLQTGRAAALVEEPEQSEDVHELLEKSLSIAEIDKEIGRIRQQQAALAGEMEETSRRLDEQERLIESKREDVGRVLRAYYMGQRDSLLSALLSADSFSRFIAILDYVQQIFARDKRILNDFKEQLRLLQEGYLKQEEEQARLDGIEERLQRQRERVLELESQLEEELSGRSDEDRLRMMIEQLGTFWETAGLYEVEQYFQALSKAMRKLPEWVQDNKQYLEMNGLQYTLRVPEEDLNAFLREQNDIFRNFRFRFEDGKVVATGERDNIEVSVTGRYTIIDEPQNGLLFHVDELLFNGFALPDTTRAELEKKFDLGFYPGLIVSFVKATGVEMEDGELIVKLNLKW